ncbi:MAG: type III-A CRISPR-associated protein Cas10/Csm1 [Candidatus Accumulibacter sp.]|jgi:CRISPR-associated protein Csm1|nr:type III-A CRISPR-associated protein Cas10/Csm1 [Accumulibacter sp.]
MTSLLDASSRVAFAALLHDLGKFAERAAPEVSIERLDAHLTNYCQWNEKGGRRFPTRKHAAHTALFLEKVERAAPDLIQADVSPFASRQDSGDITDSLINAAAMHHVPETLLQWIIATADRVASGFEREDFETYNNDAGETFIGRNHYQARLWTLFEQVRLQENAQRPAAAADFKWRHPLKPLTPENLFPVKRDACEPNQNEPAQKEYRALWDGFFDALEKIPASHRSQWPLWLDHLDTLWQIYTHAIPSSTFGRNKPEISLYDHSKATAAFAAALWRWHIAEGPAEDDAIRRHKERADWDTEKFLLVQGDFFGIQDFIFSEGAETNKDAAKLLRGRSFQVSLFAELAALKVLEVLELPSTSQIINAAGKFLIVAPNTPDARQKLADTRRELNDWFLRETFGLAGIGLAVKPASCNDFLAGRFDGLMNALFADLDRAKLNRFDLTGGAPKVFDADYPRGICQYNNRWPADKLESENKASARLSRDQIEIGKALAHRDRLLIIREDADRRAGGITVLETPVFDYRIGFTADEEITGRLGELARSGQLRRCWDFSPPERLTDTLWHGYARRYINARVPRFSGEDEQTVGKYREAEADIEVNAPKTFNHLACEDRSLEKTEDGKEKWIGQIALATLKGDVDNLGAIFRRGLEKMSFAKMASLSRQMNAFFAVWLPAFCNEKYPNTYTVFAGGDDFFLIGPWRGTQKLAADMADRFKAFVAENPEIHFSAGFSITKPGHPIHALAEQAEYALERAKGYEASGAKEKNAVCLYGEVVPWAEWREIARLEREIDGLARDYALSAGYIYGLLSLIDQAVDKTNPESAMWRSRFAYRTCRYVVDKLRDKAARPTALARLADTFGERGIAARGGKFRIPLFNFFYSKRG